jgi:hypothetical protein
MIGEANSADAYAKATDSTRRIVSATREYLQQWQRVKPDPEINPLMDLDCEKVATRRWAAGAGY